ncbi:unnamed protein product [Auanema sp. JU1783]|nr:unnamed protein product [Auanema sp. JU1783]
MIRTLRALRGSVNIEPIYRKRSKRAINNTRYNAGIENKSAKPNGTTQPTATLNRNSSADLMVVAASPRSDMLLAAPVSERQRSRSLCAVQMEKDTQTMSACPSPAPAPKKENGRKTSNGLVPSLNRMRIQQCYKMAKPVIGEAILKRAASSRAELRALFSRLNDEQFGLMARQMFDLIDDSVTNIDKADEVLQHAKEFGSTYADLCPFGFRPDFFSHLADAAIAECVKLDGGVHKRCDTLLAWSQLIGALFSSVRDGYYQRVRYQRRSSLPQHTITKQLSMDITATIATQE